MPKVSFPKTKTGWIVVLVSSMVGFVAGTAALEPIGKAVTWLSKRF